MLKAFGLVRLNNCCAISPANAHAWIAAVDAGQFSESAEIQVNHRSVEMASANAHGCVPLSINGQQNILIGSDYDAQSRLVFFGICD
jgi:hypothetical protein